MQRVPSFQVNIFLSRCFATIRAFDRFWNARPCPASLGLFLPSFLGRKVLFSLISSAVAWHLCLATLTVYYTMIENASTFLKKIFRSPRKSVFMRLSAFKKVPKIPILWTLFPENPRGFSNSEHRCFTAFLQTALNCILISKFFSTIFSRFTCRKYYTGFYILHLFRSLKSVKYR